MFSQVPKSENTRLSQSSRDLFSTSKNDPILFSNRLDAKLDPGPTQLPAATTSGGHSGFARFAGDLFSQTSGRTTASTSFGIASNKSSTKSGLIPLHASYEAPSSTFSGKLGIFNTQNDGPIPAFTSSGVTPDQSKTAFKAQSSTFYNKLGIFNTPKDDPLPAFTSFGEVSRPNTKSKQVGDTRPFHTAFRAPSGSFSGSFGVFDTPNDDPLPAFTSFGEVSQPNTKSKQVRDTRPPHNAFGVPVETPETSPIPAFPNFGVGFTQSNSKPDRFGYSFGTRPLQTPEDSPIPAFTSFGVQPNQPNVHNAGVGGHASEAGHPSCPLGSASKSLRFGRAPPQGYTFRSPAEEKLYHAIMTLIEEADEETGLKAVEFYFKAGPWSDKVPTLYEIFRAALKREYRKICACLTNSAQDQSFTLYLLELVCRGPMDAEMFKLLVDSERSLSSPKSSSECARHYRNCLKLVSTSKADMPEITDLILKRIKETHDKEEEIRAKRSVAEALISSLNAGNVESANQMLDTFDLADIKKHFDKSATAEFRKRLDGLDLPERLARLRTK